jgi:hypothetical protein
MFLGAVLALLLCNANDVVRSDGSRVVLMKNPTWQTEVKGLWETLKYEPYVMLLFPMFWTSNWFYTYQQNAVNAARFDTRTRALNGLLYYLAQIAGALILGYLLDIDSVRRSVRAKACLVMLLVATMCIWGGGFAWQNYTRWDVNTTINPTTGKPLNPNALEPWDWQTKGYVGPMFLYIFYGLYDSLWQASVYWYILSSRCLYSYTNRNRFMGALSNSGRRSANYVGFYKGIQSAGAAVIWSLDSHKVSYMTEFISTWVLLTFSIFCAAPVIFYKIQDHVTVEEDLVGTDETLADVLPAGYPEKAVV